jgi:hypothetical protein
MAEASRTNQTAFTPLTLTSLQADATKAAKER